MDQELGVDDHVANEDGHGVKEPAVQADDEHGRDIEQEVADGDQERVLGGFLLAFVVHHPHSVLSIDLGLLFLQMKYHKNVAAHHGKQSEAVHAEHGDADLDMAGQCFTYTPDLNYNGLDTVCIMV